MVNREILTPTVPILYPAPSLISTPLAPSPCPGPAGHAGQDAAAHVGFPVAAFPGAVEGVAQMRGRDDQDAVGSMLEYSPHNMR